MADFKNLATQYVLADKPSVERGLAKLAADGTSVPGIASDLTAGNH